MEPLLFPLKTESANLKIANIWTGLGIKLYFFFILIQIFDNLYERSESEFPFLIVFFSLIIELIILVMKGAYFLFVWSYSIMSSTVLSVFSFLSIIKLLINLLFSLYFFYNY